MLLALRSPGAARSAGEAQQARRRARSDVPVGGRAATTSSASPSSRASTTARAPTPAQATAVAMLLHASPMYFYKKGKGRYRKAPPECAQGRARLGRAQAARGRADRDVGERSSRRTACPTRCARKLADAALRAGQECARMEGAGVPRATHAQTNPVALLAACGAIPSTHDYHFDRVPRTGVSARRAFPPWGTLPAVPELPRQPVRGRSRSTTRRRPRSTTRSRCASSPTAITKSASTSRVPRWPCRADGPLDASRVAVVDGLHAGPQAHDAARRSDRRVHAGAGTPRPALSLVRRRRRPTACRSRHATRVERVHVAANLRARHGRRCVRQRAARRRRPAVDARAARAVEARAALVDARGKNDINRIDYSFDVDWDARARTAGSRSCRASAAARSTS